MDKARKLSRIGLICLAIAVCGCDRWRKQTLRNDARDPQAGSDPVSTDPSFERPSELQGFFKGGRAGTLSPEARDIERSLGVQ